jgi:hypothetical protein
VSVETDDDAPAKDVRYVMTNHPWFALEDVGAGRIHWRRTLRVRALSDGLVDAAGLRQG